MGTATFPVRGTGWLHGSNARARRNRRGSHRWHNPGQNLLAPSPAVPRGYPSPLHRGSGGAGRSVHDGGDANQGPAKTKQTEKSSRHWCFSPFMAEFGRWPGCWSPLHQDGGGTAGWVTPACASGQTSLQGGRPSSMPLACPGAAGVPGGFPGCPASSEGHTARALLRLSRGRALRALAGKRHRVALAAPLLLLLHFVEDLCKTRGAGGVCVSAKAPPGKQGQLRACSPRCSPSGPLLGTSVALLPLCTAEGMS